MRYTIHLEKRNFTKHKVSTVRLKSLSETALGVASLRSPHREIELSLVFVGDARMRTINRNCRGEDRTTDVLSFSFLEKQKISAPIPYFLGEIFISVPEAVRQAKMYGHSFDEEIQHLFVHGILHILGYDHERSPGAARKMRKLEEKVLK